ncbi:AfsR/SARP family transcriptional regulator [Streptomyces sp. LUP30]|uniref:AfsR/SARP family transcriptional regulator n=1 Tax=Streptomyces sp. LUP30 TaxID=1890285 RepID=UPI000AC2DC44|nr:AfsR/SARP family transcriptional regulator [Streptomyces sp. LUP30]
MNEPTRFQLLGPVRVWRGERELDPGFPQQRALLALLLAHAGRPVPPGEILDVLWGERPPVSAPNVVRRYAGALRRLLEPGLAPRAPGRRLLRRTGGYLLEADTDEVDLLRFRDLTRRGKRAAATGRAEAAARHLVLALGEWRGPVAMGIPESVRAHVQFTALRRELLDATRLAADAALLCGRAEQVLPALRRAAAHDPLDEPLHARLVLALAACGLQAEALGAYDDVRRRLARDLNVAPGPELTAAHTRVLRQEVGRLRSGPTVSLGRPAEIVEMRRDLVPAGAGTTAAPEQDGDPGDVDVDFDVDGEVRADPGGRAAPEPGGDVAEPGSGDGVDDMITVPVDVTGAAERGTDLAGGSAVREAGAPGLAASRPAASGACALRPVDSGCLFRSGSDERGVVVPERADPRATPARRADSDLTHPDFAHPHLAHPHLTHPHLTHPDRVHPLPTRPRPASAAPTASTAPLAPPVPLGPRPPAAAVVAHTDARPSVPAPARPAVRRPAVHRPAVAEFGAAGGVEGGGGVRAVGPASWVRPAQLPPALTSFVGRAAESEWLDEVVGSGAAVVSVGGMAGVGKSALVLRWAHGAAARFPDGQLYVPLRGFDRARPPVEPADALRALLAALGVPPSGLPDGVDALAGLYRTLLGGRRVLVVLDDAADTEQVRALLPAAPGCLALVTSRRALPGLVVSGARALSLAPPSAEDARGSLVARIGAERTAAEPAAVDEIVARCGRLPLALAAVATRAAGRRDFPLAALADELRESHNTLDALPVVRAAFLDSYRRLEPDAARVLRVLPRHGGAELTPAAVATLAGLPTRRAGLLLAVLADAHFLTEHAPGRYAVHELVRAFASERGGAGGLPGGA